jgi:hypothetical protein
MGRGKANKLARGYNLGFLPESGEMLLVAAYQIVSFGRIIAFEKHIVIRVAGDFEAAGRGDDMAAAPDELQQLLAYPFANAQLLACEHIPIFLQNGPRNIETRGFANS